MLQRPVDPVALPCAQFVEVCVNPLARLRAALAVAAPQVPGDFFARQHGLGDVVEHLGNDATITCALPTFPGKALPRTPSSSRRRADRACAPCRRAARDEAPA